MYATSFIHMLRQKGIICFYKVLYATFKLALDIKKYRIYLASYSPLNEGHSSTLTNSMHRTYSDIDEPIIFR